MDTSILAYSERLSVIRPSGRLRAWIDHHRDNKVEVAFIGVVASPGGVTVVSDREPAVRIFCSKDKAREWVESEAAELGLPVEWVAPESRSPT